MRYFLLALMFMVIGCGQVGQKSEPLKPTIVVNRTETATSGINLVIYYHNHTQLVDQNNSVYAVAASLNTIEKISDYKKQAEFLLSQLEEVENKMKLAESPEDGEGTKAILVVEFNGSDWLNVRYQNHTIGEDGNRRFNGVVSVTLTTRKQIEEYKKQVAFLCQMLEQNKIPPRQQPIEKKSKQSEPTQ